MFNQACFARGLPDEGIAAPNLGVAIDGAEGTAGLEVKRVKVTEATGGCAKTLTVEIQGTSDQAAAAERTLKEKYPNAQFEVIPGE